MITNRFALLNYNLRYRENEYNAPICWPVYYKSTRRKSRQKIFKKKIYNIIVFDRNNIIRPPAEIWYSENIKTMTRVKRHLLEAEIFFNFNLSLSLYGGSLLVINTVTTFTAYFVENWCVHAIGRRYASNFYNNYTVINNIFVYYCSRRLGEGLRGKFGDNEREEKKKNYDSAVFATAVTPIPMP